MNNKIQLIILSLMIVSCSALAVGESGGDKANSAYKKAKIKNRARLQTKRGVESIGNKQYVYVDDKAVDLAIQLQNLTNKFSLGSVTMKKNSKIKEVSIYVDSKGKKKIKVDSKGKEPATVDIGHVKVEKGANVKRIKSIIEMEVNVDEK